MTNKKIYIYNTNKSMYFIFFPLLFIDDIVLAGNTKTDHSQLQSILNFYAADLAKTFKQLLD